MDKHKTSIKLSTPHAVFTRSIPKVRRIPLGLSHWPRSLDRGQVSHAVMLLMIQQSGHHTTVPRYVSYYLHPAGMDNDFKS